MIFFNPFILLLLVFLTYFSVPSIGRFVLPIAMNVAYFLFFGASLIVALKIVPHEKL